MCLIIIIPEIKKLHVNIQAKTKHLFQLASIEAQLEGKGAYLCILQEFKPR